MQLVYGVLKSMFMQPRSQDELVGEAVEQSEETRAKRGFGGLGAEPLENSESFAVSASKFSISSTLQDLSLF